MTRRHTLPKLELLKYALEGARTRKGVSLDLSDEEWELLNKDISEIARRIKLAEAAEQRKEQS